MPAPIKRGERYMPGLDGLRAIAVIAVIIYHLGFTWFPGGLLGVGVFFTLSGYLITDILLNPVDKGGVRLLPFWLARARRLLPALFLMLIIVTAWVTVFGPHQPPDFRDAVITAAFYVNNWYLIFHDVSYFAQFGTPEPLNHLWSLSVEEQFYIVWPFVIILGAKLFPRVEPTTGARFRMAGATLVLALISMIVMIVLYSPGIDPSRVYYGTDTRALELLVGAALAMVWPSRRLHARIKPEARRTIDIVGGIGLLVVFILFLRAQEYDPFLYRGGFLLLSVATAMAVAALAHPASRLGPIVGCRPMLWVGQRSYGIYLWHFPIIVLTTPDGAQGVDLPRAFLQVAATFIVAALSWKYVEDPIRHGALRRIWADFKGGRYRRENITRGGWAAIGGCAVVLMAAFAGLAGAGTGPDRSEEPGNISVAQTVTGKETDAAESNRTICKSVVHVGDSTSEGLVSDEYLDPSKQIAAQYERVGAPVAHLEVSGARSIYERFEGQPNAQEVAQAWRDQGFDGCWVFAMGTNEAANVSAGSAVGYDERIDSMMSVADGDPVLWVNVKSIVPSGPYAAANMESWDAALLKACNRYPNMRIYDWASDVRDQWFIDDGIHFTSQGYAQRGKLIADALLTAFPADGDVDGGNSDNCLIDPDSKAIAEATKDNVPKKKRGGAADSTTDTETTPTTPTTPTTTTDPSVTG
ncbi:MAG: acyltransferase [Solirubrobacterales bacterium]|nr:acyltransferase [Solirubrobacterales bacterium]